MTNQIAHLVEYRSQFGGRCVERVFNQPDRDMAAMHVLNVFPAAQVFHVEAIDFDAPRVWGEQDFHRAVA